MGKLLLALSDGKQHSGASLGQRLGVSRAAISRAVASLRALGLDVQARSGVGYRLVEGYQPFDLGALREQLAEKGVDLHVHFRTPSTNDEAMALAGQHTVTVVISECQTAGRGRRGRSWNSPLGGIYLSVAIQLGPLLEPPAPLSVAVAVACAHCLGKCGADVGVKWPNDLLIQGRKVGGILTELRGEPFGPCSVVIGVGLNLSVAPDPHSFNAPSSGEVDPLPSGSLGSLDRNQTAAALVNTLIQAARTFETEGVSPLLANWKQYDVLLNRPVVLYIGQRSVVGEARGVDEAGRLILRHDDGEERVVSGETRLRATR